MKRQTSLAYPALSLGTCTHCPLNLAPRFHAADDVEEIQGAVRTAIQQCCVQLKSKIAKQQAAREQRQRKKNLTKYIPNVAAALYTVLQAVAVRREEGPAGGKGTISRAAALMLCLPGTAAAHAGLVTHLSLCSASIPSPFSAATKQLSFETEICSR